MNGFLGDAQYFSLHCGIERTVGAEDAELRGERIVACGLHEPSYSHRQGGFVRILGAQSPNRLARIGEAVAHVLARLIQLLGRCIHFVLAQQLRQHLQLH